MTRPNSLARLGLLTLILAALLALPATAQRLPEAEGGQAQPGAAGPIVTPTGASSTFSDEPSFLAAAGCAAISLESFEGLPATNASNQVTIVTSDFTMSSSLPPQMGVWNAPFVGGFATDGTQWVGISENAFVTPLIVTITFNSPVDHFGINFTDYGDFGGGNLDFTSDAGDNFTAAVSGMPDGNSQFFGIVNPTSTFSVVTLSHSIGGEFYGVDELYYCAGPSDADLSITKTVDSTSANPGDTLVYTVTVTNNGPSDATGVTVTDPLPMGVTYVMDDCGGMNVPPWTWNLGALANGASAACNVTVTVDAGASGDLTNTATVSGDQTDPVPGNESSTAVTTVGTVLDIPTLSVAGLALLLLLLVGAAMGILAHRRAA